MAKRNAFNKATFIGVGLLGGSAALAMRRAYPGIRIDGLGRRRSSLNKALRRGQIDAGHLNPEKCIPDSDLVVLATPVGAFEHYFRILKPLLKKGAMVTDVGSTKADVVKLAEKVFGKGGPFIGSHPMAGSEQTGPEAARDDLLTGALCIITPTANTPPELTKKAQRLWKALGMRTAMTSPARHDAAVARISHLPHLLSAALMLTPEEQDMAFAATGFADMTRLAGGDVGMWRDILMTNDKAILKAIGRYEKQLARLKQAVAAGDEKAVSRFLEKARERKKN